MADNSLSAARVREVLDYDPLTGVFIRKVRLAQCHQVGDRADFQVAAGHLKGYRRIGFDNQRYLAHRVAWLYVHGDWPKDDIDHINGQKGDNRISNLRDVTFAVNMQNRRKPHKDNKSGFLGVSAHVSGTFVAKVGGKYIGSHATPEEAHEAYLQAKRLMHEGCTI